MAFVPFVDVQRIQNPMIALFCQITPRAIAKLLCHYVLCSHSQKVPRTQRKRNGVLRQHPAGVCETLVDGQRRFAFRQDRGERSVSWGFPSPLGGTTVFPFRILFSYGLFGIGSRGNSDKFGCSHSAIQTRRPMVEPEPQNASERKQRRATSYIAARKR